MTGQNQKQLGKTLWIATAKRKHNGFLKELGLSPLP